MSLADEYSFGRADPADEPEIRRLVADTPMPGSITVRFEREPDYFLGCSVMGDVCDVLIARHEPDGELAGCLCRTERTLWVNDEERRIGSIGQVRASRRHQGRWLLHRGLPLLHAYGPADLLYTGVVARANARARAVLLERRPPGGVHARRLGGITTHGLLLRRGQGCWRRPSTIPGLAVDGATADDLPEVVSFLRRYGPRRQLFPAYRIADFVDGVRLRGLAPGDLGVARMAGSIVGVLGTWDQRAFKQDVVHAYAPALRRVGPAWDRLARLLSAPSLPSEGTALPAEFAVAACVVDDDPDVMRSLLCRAARRAARRGSSFLLLGLADADPLVGALGRWPRISYDADLFAFSWSEREPGAWFDGRVPFVEIATL
jgi:hypothetical protein